MKRGKKKDEIITFKVDAALSAALTRTPNRSEFIRSAVLAALENSCPLCQGAGTLTPDQKRHWEAFAPAHAVEECGRCHAVHLSCAAQPQRRQAHPGRAPAGARGSGKRRRP